MNSADLRRLQLAQLQIMKNIHHICIKNNLIYYIVGGTAIGAVRHKGFIPWDIDIDIAMPRDDYEKFLIIANKELDKMYKLVCYKLKKDYNRPHAEIEDLNTYIEFKEDEYNRKRYAEHIYLDIFPLDNVPNDINLRKKQANKIRFIRHIKYRKIGRNFSNNYTKKWIKLIIKLLLYPIPFYKLNKWEDDEMKRYNSISACNMLCNFAGRYSAQKESVPKEFFGTPKLIKFEDIQLFAPNMVEAYLEHIYGNYMKLPPLTEIESSLSIIAKVDFNYNENINGRN